MQSTTFNSTTSLSRLPTTILLLTFLMMFETTLTNKSLVYNRAAGLAMARVDGVIVGSQYGFKENWSLITIHSPKDDSNAECVVQLRNTPNKPFYLVKTQNKHKNDKVGKGDMVYYVSPEDPVLLFNVKQYYSDNRSPNDSICNKDLNSTDHKEILQLLEAHFGLLSSLGDGMKGTILNQLYMTKVDNDKFKIGFAANAIKNIDHFDTQISENDKQMLKKYLNLDSFGETLQKLLSSFEEESLSKAKQLVKNFEVELGKKHQINSRILSKHDNPSSQDSESFSALDHELDNDYKSQSIVKEQTSTSQKDDESSIHNEDNKSSNQKTIRLNKSSPFDHDDETSMSVFVSDSEDNGEYKPTQFIAPSFRFSDGNNSVKSDQTAKDAFYKQPMIKRKKNSGFPGKRNRDDETSVSTFLSETVKTSHEVEDVRSIPMYKFEDEESYEPVYQVSNKQESVPDEQDRTDSHHHETSTNSHVTSKNSSHTISHNHDASEKKKDISSEKKSSSNGDADENIHDAELISNNTPTLLNQDEHSGSHDKSNDSSEHKEIYSKETDSDHSRDASHDVNSVHSSDNESVGSEKKSAKSDESKKDVESTHNESVHDTSQHSEKQKVISEKQSVPIHDEEHSHKSSKIEEPNPSRHSEKVTKSRRSKMDEMSKSRRSKMDEMSKSRRSKMDNMSKSRHSKMDDMSKSRHSKMDEMSKSRKTLKHEMSNRSRKSKVENNKSRKSEEKSDRVSNHHDADEDIEIKNKKILEPTKKIEEPPKVTSSEQEQLEKEKQEHLQHDKHLLSFVNTIPDIIEKTIQEDIHNIRAKLEKTNTQELINNVVSDLQNKLNEIFEKNQNHLNLISSMFIEKYGTYPESVPETLSYSELVNDLEKSKLKKKLQESVQENDKNFKLNIVQSVMNKLQANIEEFVGEPSEHQKLHDHCLEMINKLMEDIQSALESSVPGSLFSSIMETSMDNTLDWVFNEYQLNYESSPQNKKYGYLNGDKIDTNKLLMFLAYNREVENSQIQKSIMLKVFSMKKSKLII